MTLQELKQRAKQMGKHPYSAARDVAWELTFEEIKSLPIDSFRFTRKVARYEESGNPETLGFLREMVAGAIVASE